MDESLLDSDTFSEVLKQKDPNVVHAAQKYLKHQPRYALSAITFYEVHRGLIEKNAARQLAKFHGLASTCEIVPISLVILNRAANLWVTARAAGLPHNDADLIIAATALDVKRVLVTGNTSHFSWIAGLRIVDWRSPSP